MEEKTYKLPFLSKDLHFKPSGQSRNLYILTAVIILSLIALIVFIPKNAQFESALDLQNASVSYFLYSEKDESLINLDRVNVMITPDFYIKPKFGTLISEIKVENLLVTTSPKIGQVKRFYPDDTVVDINCVGYFMQECNSLQNSIEAKDEGATFTYDVVRGDIDDLTEVSAENLKPSFNVHVLGIGVFNPEKKYNTTGKSLAELANVDPDQLDATLKFDLVAKGALNTTYRKSFTLNIDGDDVVRRAGSVPLISN